MRWSTRHRRSIGILLSAGVVAILFCFAEIWFRISYRYTELEQHPRSYREIAQMSYDTFLGYIPTPNFSDKGYQTNGQHLRYDEDLQSPKPEDEIRIFVTGGSTA